MWQVDGAQGEGGGQLLRTALALAAATGTPLHIENIRAARRPPGLAPQHLAAAQALAALSDGRLEGAGLRSSALSFWPGATLRDELTVDVGTAGNLILILHTLLPVLAAPRLPDDIGYRYRTNLGMSGLRADVLAGLPLPQPETGGLRTAGAGRGSAFRLAGCCKTACDGKAGMPRAQNKYAGIYLSTPRPDRCRA